jgi:hypothetical protein
MVALRVTSGQLFADYNVAGSITTNSLNCVAKSGDTMTGKLILPASTTLSAPLNIPHGTDPASPVNGDLWLNGTLRYRDQAGNTRFVADINRPNSFTQNQIITAGAATTAAALRITQEGTGESLRVEDESNPDATPFVISNTGRVGIGTAPDATVGLKLDSTGVKFNDDTIQTTSAARNGSTSLGYTGTGTGGTVTQLTDKSTGVTLDKLCGQITTSNASLGHGTSVSFVLTNNKISPQDVVIVNIASGATTNSYIVTVEQVNNGSCRIQIRNIQSSGSLSEAIVLNFAVIKAVNA